MPPSITPALEDLIPPAANLIVVQGNATVDEESKLGGNVVIGGDLNLQGIGSPGNSIGLVVVGGNATFGADSVYEVEIDGAGHADRIAAGGIATLEGGAVTVTALDLSKSYKQAQTYTILSAEGGVDGTFGSLSTSSVFLKTSLAYTANTVDLTVSIPANAFQSAATSGNQFAAAAALDSLTQSGSSLALYNTIAFQTSLAQARSAFEQLAGDSYASVKTGLIESAHLTTDAINARLRDDVNADGEANTAAWISGFGSWIDHGADSNAGSLKTSTGGVIAGVDVDLSGWRLGLAAGYSQSDLKMKRRSASADSDNVHLGIYTGKKWGPLGLRAGLSHTWHSVDLDRSVAFAGFNGSFESDYKARTLQAFGELSYDIALGSASLTPFGGLTHVSLHSKSFSEDGGLGALNVKSGTTSTTFTSLGLRASAPLKVGGNGASLRGALGWRHAFGDIVPESVQAFTGSSAFSVDGVAIAKDAVLVEAGFDIALSKGSTFGLGYFGQFGDGTSQNGVNARIKFSF
ncbi:autotransporter domain-containing protein [Caenibius tardaugens NBRC 16725]|nr:autotransporter domain-containing protein [Caenibius tardaugens NBRC 16725]